MILDLKTRPEDIIDMCVLGNKAKNIIYLNSLGVRTPEGFVISSDVFEKFITINNLESELENFQGDYCGLFEKATLGEKNSSTIYERVNKLSCEYYAVRSSATQEDSKEKSFAGQYKTVIGVKKQNLENAIKHVFASCFSESAKKYCPEKNSMAVIVQELVYSEISGVAFTYDFINKTEENLIVESTFGLCEPIVSGLITPDLYVISKNSGHILLRETGDKKTNHFFENGSIIQKKNLEKKDSLCSEHIRGITRLACDIEHFFGTPQDIEFTFDKSGKLFILQARPITALERW
jgi:phosphoenolpyruvate synthase/pyruvate phosphate dikinase